MLILSLDCCGPACGVCIWQDGRVLAKKVEAMQRGQDARLIPMVLEVIEQAALRFEHFDRLAVTRGPGSFTGLRVGLAAARGMALAAKKPVIGIDRFAIYHALYAKDDRNLLVVLDSKRAELFCKFFPTQDEPHPPCMMTEHQITMFINDHVATDVVSDHKSPEDILATCSALAAKADLQSKDFAAIPLYIREPDVTLVG